MRSDQLVAEGLGIAAGVAWVAESDIGAAEVEVASAEAEDTVDAGKCMVGTAEVWAEAEAAFVAGEVAAVLVWERLKLARRSELEFLGRQGS